MTAVFVDTSALLAVLDADDRRHPEAAAVFEQEIHQETALVTSNYVLVETAALVQRRLGIDALRTMHLDLLALLSVEWVRPQEHAAAMSAVLAAGRKRLSLVDCTSFEVMRRLGITSAFAFDDHFPEQGFSLVTP